MKKQAFFTPYKLVAALALLAAYCPGLFAQSTQINFNQTYQDIPIPDPAPAAYVILTAVGGDGGKIERDNVYKGGRGAYVRAVFAIGTGQGELAPGGTLRFIVGGCGDSDANMANIDGKGGGGGGGTGIAYRSPQGKWTLLLVAGGGGGGSWTGLNTRPQGIPGYAYSKTPPANSDNAYRSSDEIWANFSDGAGAFYSSQKDGYGMYSQAGWAGGPDSGEPTGGGAHDKGKLYYFSGGWGFGAGGVGSRASSFNAGGGGGYIGGQRGEECNASFCFPGDGVRYTRDQQLPAEGGSSYVNEDHMVVNGILTFSRGHTDKPQNGYAIYEFRDQAHPYSFMQFDKDRTKCIEDYNAETNKGTNVQLGACVDADKQRWVFYENRSILFAKDAGKCLDLSNSNLSNGTNIQLWDCNNSDAQRWVYDGTTKQIRSGINFTKCIDLVNGRAVDGNNIQLWDCKDIAAQRWYIDQATLATLADTFNRIHFVKDPGKCLDLEKANPVNGGNIQLYHCHHAASQYWHFDGNTIRYYANQSKCLDLRDSKIDNGTNIQLTECNGNNAQRWVYDGMTRSFRSFVHGAKCIDVSGAGTDDNTNIQIWDCNESDSQQFIISN
ncbi:MAG: RICIN domain-containing protein [Saprospiraceae bacterium]|nr:ricin-type beta-trefoil lectin domain protein [Saprospiraceae bacterium]